MGRLTLAFQRLPHGSDLPVPSYQTSHSAGMDLYAALVGSITVAPGLRTLVPTGFAMAIPAGYEAQIRPRSGLALNQGLTVVNAPGTVDADYRGEIGVILINSGQKDVIINRGERIAQMVIAPVIQCVWREVDSLPETKRGAGGFGSTGSESGF